MLRTALPLIVIIHPDALVRNRLIRLLAPAFPSYGTAVAADARAGIALVQQSAGQLRLILLDPQLPQLEGRDLSAVLGELAPRVPVLPFSRRDDLGPILRELEGGARAHSAGVWSRLANDKAQQADGDAVEASDTAGSNERMVQLPQTDVRRVRELLDTYLRRFPTPAREIIQVRNILAKMLDDAP